MRTVAITAALIMTACHALHADWPTVYMAACRVSAPDGGNGSGCCYYRDDQHVYVLTNQHVVGSAQQVYCHFWRSGTQSASIPGHVIWRVNRNQVDAAVIRIPRSAFGGYEPPAIPFGPDPGTGQDIISVGCPVGSWPTLWHGRVIEAGSTVWWRPGRHTVQGYDITRGRSGSAVFDSAGTHIVALLAWGDGRPEVSGGMAISRVLAAMRGQLQASADDEQRTLIPLAALEDIGDASRFTFQGRLRDDAHALAKVELREGRRLDWSRGVPWVYVAHYGPHTYQCYMLEGLEWSQFYASDVSAARGMYAATWSTPVGPSVQSLLVREHGDRLRTNLDAARADIERRNTPPPVPDDGGEWRVGVQCPGGICPIGPRPSPQPQPNPGTPWPDLPPSGGGSNPALEARVAALEQRVAATEPVITELQRLYADYRDRWPEIRALIDSTGSERLKALASRIEEFDRAIRTVTTEVQQVDSTVRAVDQQVQQQVAETSRLKAALDAAKERVLSPDFLLGIVERVSAARSANPDAGLKDAIVSTIRADLAEVRSGLQAKSGADVTSTLVGVGLPSAAAAAIGIAWAVAHGRRNPIELLSILRAARETPAPPSQPTTTA